MAGQYVTSGPQPKAQLIASPKHGVIGSLGSHQHGFVTQRLGPVYGFGHQLQVPAPVGGANGREQHPRQPRPQRRRITGQVTDGQE